MHLEKIRENQGSRFDRYVIGTLIIVFTFFVAQPLLNAKDSIKITPVFQLYEKTHFLFYKIPNMG